MLAFLGFVVTLYVLYRIVAYVVALATHLLLQSRGKDPEKMRLLEHTEARDVDGVINNGLAAFAPGKMHLVAGALAACLPMFAIPVVHWVYIVWIRFYDTSESSWQLQMTTYADAVGQVYGYLPRILINVAALAVLGAFFAHRRRRLLRRSPYRNFFGLRVASTEVFATLFGWFVYFATAIMPRIQADGSVVNMFGMINAGGGWLWVMSGPMISWYMHSAQNAILWGFFRYRWGDALPGIVKMMAKMRMNLPYEGIKNVKVDEERGAVDVDAYLDDLSAPRLRDSLLAVSGLSYPQVAALGPLPGEAVRIVKLPPRMKPLPPIAFKRPQGPPAGYGAENKLIEVEEAEEQGTRKGRRR